MKTEMKTSQSNPSENSMPPKEAEIVTMAPTQTRDAESSQDPVEGESEALMAMGYVPQLKRDFGYLQLIGCAFTVTNSWLGVAGGFSTGVVIGGSACLVYGLMIVAFFNVAIVISLGELMSAFPNAGGQYYWSMRLAPKKLSRVSAYICGICNLLGGLAASSSSVVSSAYMIMGAAKLTHPTLVIKNWQIFLVAILFNCICGLGNLSRRIFTRAGFVGMCVSIGVFVTLIIVTPSVSPSLTSSSFVFNSVENISGWDSPAMSFFAGMINANYAFGLIDTAVHLAEEVHHPEKIIPKALLIIVVVGFFTAWPLAVVLMYCLTDFDTVIGTETGVPLLQLFDIALRGNKGGAIFMQMLVVLAFFLCVINVHTYQARICWAFSRDGGLPFSKWLSRVSPDSHLPINAHIATLSVSCVLTVLPVASTTAFNSLITGVIVFPYLSFLLPVAYSLLPQNRKTHGPFYLGKIGLVARLLTIFYALFTTIVYSFPYFMPVTSSNMNYFSAILGIVFLYAIIDWFVRARHHFTNLDHVD